MLVLSAPEALADCCCWGPPWLRARQRVKCFPRESPGKPRQPPAAEHIKEEAFLPASSARADGVRARVTLQLGQEASHQSGAWGGQGPGG